MTESIGAPRGLFQEEPESEPEPDKSEGVPAEEITTTEANVEIIQAEKEVRDWAKKTVQEWHDKVAPDYIFVSETSAIPHGYVLKEVWKGAYPDEECPRFYRIDPKATKPIYRGDENKEKRIKIRKGFDAGRKNYFDRRITKDSAKIIVFDEGNDMPLDQYSGRSIEHAVSIVEDGTKLIGKKAEHVWGTKGDEGTKGQNILGGGTLHKGELGYPDIYYSDCPTYKLFAFFDWQPVSSGRGLSRDELLASSKTENGELEQMILDGKFTYAGGIVKEPEQRKRAIKFVDELKRIGQEAGKELFQELQNKKET